MDHPLDRYPYEFLSKQARWSSLVTVPRGVKRRCAVSRHSGLLPLERTVQRRLLVAGKDKDSNGFASARAPSHPR